MKKSLIEKVDFYYNGQGYMVFTEKYHLERGYCCGNGCRHCPYNYEKVPEPKRTLLLNKRKDNRQP
ncbi:DUF5522 domain-containing protein [Chitinophaga sp. CB10]|uniref:DUF5522 domain-containing protein n=1 Tax=Chitinophaga sp. CB10 TaxID=1891659 RepID=UPI000AFB7E41|nr:DUF5522 domain-containing protein [Chitinophaga sp. CB10]